MLKKHLPLLFCFASWISAAQAQCEADTTVYLTDFIFTPSEFTISVGQTVAFVNAEGTHNVDGTAVSNPVSFFLEETEGNINGVCMGTVTFDVGKAIDEIRAGRVEYRVDKAGVVHAPFGKASFEEDKLKENAEALIGAILKAKPAAVKGKYVKSVSMSSTMGPGVRIDDNDLLGLVEG